MKEAGNNRTVLLVEDSDDDAFFFERSFNSCAVPARLLRVAHGGEAVDYLQKASGVSADLSQTHLVFLDLKMPVLNGFEVLKWIKERGISIEVVVLSGSDIDSDMEMARLLGASDYLVKPISTEELKKRLVREAITNSST
jgi:CheY-like chemotaxis protein